MELPTRPLAQVRFDRGPVGELQRHQEFTAELLLRQVVAGQEGGQHRFLGLSLYVTQEVRLAAQQLALADLEDDAAGGVAVADQGHRIEVATPGIDRHVPTLQLFEAA